MARLGATPTMFGNSPLKRARGPSFCTIYFRHCIMPIDFGADEIPHDEIAYTCKPYRNKQTN